MIITSLLDTDFYKLTQQQVALHQFPWVNVEYEFKCRNKANWTDRHIKRLERNIESFCQLQFTNDEIAYLRSIPFFKPSYIDFLKFYKPNIEHVDVQLVNGELQIKVKGPWFLTILFEVPLLAMVNEIYFEELKTPELFFNGGEKIHNKIKYANKTGFSFADFGTRRRFSNEWQETIIQILKGDAHNFVGTSNVYFAKKYGLKPIGTMAHELMQVGQAIDVPLVDSQKRMLQAWVDEYRGNLGIALTDVIGIDAFLKDFDLYFAKLYDGVRHDSGSPFEWADKVIAHYEKLGIDPKTKTLVFSDGLNFVKCAVLYKAYSNKINVSFGIGTNLTNSFGGITPLQIVMKIVECNGRPVAKISDSPGKGMCRDDEYVSYLKKVFGIKND
jgi:nicotinate phosphoribosyltransferase